jgi:hypothetical protein
MLTLEKMRNGETLLGRKRPAKGARKVILMGTDAMDALLERARFGDGRPKKKSSRKWMMSKNATWRDWPIVKRKEEPKWSNGRLPSVAVATVLLAAIAGAVYAFAPFTRAAALRSEGKAEKKLLDRLAHVGDQVKDLREYMKSLEKRIPDVFA